MAVMASMALMPVSMRLAHLLALHHGRRLQFEARRSLGLDLAQTVDRVTQRVDDAAHEAVADGHRQDFAGARTCWPSSIPSPLPRMTTPMSRTSRFRARPRTPSFELEQLVGHHAGQTLDVRDAVAGVGDDQADLFTGGFRRVRGRYVALEIALRISSVEIVSSVI